MPDRRGCGKAVSRKDSGRLFLERKSSPFYRFRIVAGQTGLALISNRGSVEKGRESMFPRTLVVVVAVALLMQCRAGAPAKDALALLNQVSQRYADAKAYHIEAIEESTSSNELSRHWDKRLLTAIVTPDGRYRYEGRSSTGAAR